MVRRGLLSGVLALSLVMAFGAAAAYGGEPLHPQEFLADDEGIESPPVEQTYDLADYMPTQSGQWRQGQEFDPETGEAENDFEGIVTSTGGGFFFQNWYDRDGEEELWEEDRKEAFKILGDNVGFYGEYQYELGEKGWWRMVPPIAFPRSLQLNTTYSYEGFVKHRGREFPYSFTLTLLEAGHTVTVPAGTFANCIRLRMTSSAGGESEVGIEDWAPGVGTVQDWYWYYDENGNETDYESWKVIGYGPSNAPFP